MASARKKQDEKNLKILRELVSLPANKQCFDCHQRGPTYVNMTIGSFVCTSCSGMLRGLTPPHRVKSISMASFSPDEVEQIKSRGNEYCRRIWLGLYDANHEQDTKDEQLIKDFMVAKYEKKRYYLDPSVAMKNGPVGQSTPTIQTQPQTSTPVSIPEVKPLSSLIGSTPRPIVASRALSGAFSPSSTVQSPSTMLADVSSTDPFSSSQMSANVAQPSFANFEDNPIFSASSVSTASTMPATHNSSSFLSPVKHPANSNVSGHTPTANSQNNNLQPPSEDRYAALKDLDSLMKTHSDPLSEWTTVQSSGPSWTISSSDPGTNSVFYATSQSSGGPVEMGMNGTAPVSTSTSSGFLSNVDASAGNVTSMPSSNPFTGTSANTWVSSTANSGLQNVQGGVSSFGMPQMFTANPFGMPIRHGQPNFGICTEANFGHQTAWGGMGMACVPNGQVPNGGLQSFLPAASVLGNANAGLHTSQSMNFPSKSWQQMNAVGNPFMFGASPGTTGHSSNPFL